MIAMAGRAHAQCDPYSQESEVAIPKQLQLAKTCGNGRIDTYAVSCTLHRSGGHIDGQPRISHPPPSLGHPCPSTEQIFAAIEGLRYAVAVDGCGGSCGVGNEPSINSIR